MGAARRRWSVVPRDPSAPPGWRNISGARSRQLLRHIEHSESVHEFVASLAEQARARGWKLEQLDPPHRASRYFRHNGRSVRSVQPDAFAVLRRASETCPFFLEWERRAVRPSTMLARLSPYLRYYDSHRPTDDHGTQPAVFVLFDDQLAASHFLRVAQTEMNRARVLAPLQVSDRKLLEQNGPLGTDLALTEAQRGGFRAQRSLGAAPSECRAGWVSSGAVRSARLSANPARLYEVKVSKPEPRAAVASA